MKKKRKKKKDAEPEMGYCPFDHKHWVTIQSLYRDTVGWKTRLGRLAWAQPGAMIQPGWHAARPATRP